ncbi:hypothetical protein GCM10022225_03020 [Plantactinospora mayteni]|uniref:Uncharacterized protein n=1 Tax=Plantactinospora mayteni TaxID=566021 RepID=A0ABQ4EQ57_9ACTN|nr:hypothetical protein Pma05_33630 [Plantactinospora mayteni]
MLTRAPLVLATGFDTTSELPLDLDKLGSDAVDDFADIYYGQRVLGLVVCEKDRPWNAGVGVDQQLGLDRESGVA